jgi:hypothetical protein
MLHVPWVRHSLPISPLETIRGGAGDFGDDEGSLPRGRELVHAVGLLDTPKDEITDIKGSFPNIAIVVTAKLLVMMCLSHDGSEPLFFKAVEVDTSSFLGLSFLVELDAGGSKSDIGG